MLPRERVVHDAACVCPACGSPRLSRLGEDEREVLEYVPSHFKVVVHVRPRMSCRACETITQMPAPALPIARGRPGPGLLAHVLVAKYADHLPLHRQSVIYGRAGVELERSTLADWVGQAAFLLEPLAAAITRHVRAGAALHADDTPVPVLDPARGKTKTGRLWVLLAHLIRMPDAVDEYLLWAISDGGKPFGTKMPAFKDALTEEQIWQIVTYMRAGFPAMDATSRE